MKILYLLLYTELVEIMTKKTSTKIDKMRENMLENMQNNYIKHT